MILLDTGYFVSLMTRADGLHARAVAWSLVVDEPLVVTEFVLWEMVNYFSRPADRPRGHALIDRMRGHTVYDLVPATPALFDRGLALHRQRPDKAWSLTDCVSFLVMADRGITRALAHDHHFEQAGFEALLRRDP